MSATRRFDGFTQRPAFRPDAPSGLVSMAIDENTLTQWIGEPPVIWQTPLSEVRNLRVRVGRRLQVSATIANVRYTWTTQREPYHDALIELIRQRGGRIQRDRRAMVTTTIAVAVVVLVASSASVVSVFTRSSVPTASAVGAVNVQRTDVPANFNAAAASYLEILVGTPGQVVREGTPQPKLTGATAAIWHTVTSNFQSCMGVSKADDRMFGDAGRQPRLQVSGTTFASASFQGTEVGSLNQYYDTTDMVAADLAQYSSPTFGRCWAIAGAQELLGAVTGTAAGANTKVVAANYTPITFARGWRRGGVATLTLPKNAGTFTLVAVLAVVGQQEAAFYALTGDWPRARATVNSALGAVIGRLSTQSASGAA